MRVAGRAIGQHRFRAVILELSQRLAGNGLRNLNIAMGVMDNAAAGKRKTVMDRDFGGNDE